MNAPPFDPYSQWLGISPTEQPPNYYRLLGVTLWEADPSVISAAADERVALVEAQRSGPNTSFCDALLVEVRAAREALLDPAVKASYDAALRPQLSLPKAAAPSAPMAAVPMALPVDSAPTAQPIAAPAVAPVANPIDARSINPVAPPARKSAREKRPGMSAWGWLVSSVSVVVMIAAIVWLVVFFGGRDATNATNATNADQTANANSTGGQAAPSDQAAKSESDGQLEPKSEDLPEDLPQEEELKIVVPQEGDGSVSLSPTFAQLKGDVHRDESGDHDVLVQWGLNGTAVWSFRIVKAGPFQVLINYAALDAWEGAEFEMAIVGSSSKSCTVRSSGDAGAYLQDEYFLNATRAGEHTLTVRCVSPNNDGLMVLRSIRLVPR